MMVPFPDLKSLVTKLSNDLKLLEYEVVQEYFKNGCAELSPLQRIKPECIKINPLFNVFSKWIRILRVTAYVIRFTRNLKRKKPERLLRSLIADELQLAENYWIKYIQYSAFGTEIESLKKKQPY